MNIWIKCLYEKSYGRRILFLQRILLVGIAVLLRSLHVYPLIRHLALDGLPNW